MDRVYAAVVPDGRFGGIYAPFCIEADGGGLVNMHGIVEKWVRKI